LFPYSLNIALKLATIISLNSFPVHQLRSSCHQPSTYSVKRCGMKQRNKEATKETYRDSALNLLAKRRAEILLQNEYIIS
jgi:hypothetical protein